MPPEAVAGASFSHPPPDASTRLYALHSKAMAQLALGSCVVIASLLAIPDGIALIPQSTDLVSWILKVIGVWLSAAVLWFVGFLGILHCVSFLVNGVELNEKGIKLWRFARPIPWSQIDAAAMEPQYLFSKIFSLTPVARKLTIFERRNSWRKGAKPHLVPHHLPSFLFAPEQFERLFGDITSKRFKLRPSAPDVVIAESPAFGQLKSIYRALGWQRILLSFLIAFGLVNVLGRKAIVHYQYNSGNKAMRSDDCKTAQERYQLAADLEPTFAAAWNNLGNAEFALGDYFNAEKHWRRALFYKPDFVEAKVNLAQIALQRREFTQAKALIDSALNLAPLNPTALVARGDYAIRTGHTGDAIKDARQVLSDDPKRTGISRFKAGCIFAQGRLKQGRAEEALDILSEFAPVTKEQITNNHSANSQNVTFRLLVSSAVDRALNRLDSAETNINAAVNRAPSNAEILVEKAFVEIARHNYKQAATVIDTAQKLADKNPWVYIARANLYQAEGKPDPSSTIKEALMCPNQDAESLAKIAVLYKKEGDDEEALSAAMQSLKLESNTPSALHIVRQTQQPLLMR